jgi:hypothetical protein
MKRDMDLVRDLLLKIEEEGTPALGGVPELEGHSSDAVLYHIKLLIQAGLLTAIDAGSFDGPNYLQLEMTWHGHEFLASVRDPEIWRRTKEGAGKVGSWSIGTIAEVAKAVALAKMEDLGFG